MEKFFLRFLFTGNKLDIVHQKDISVAVFVVKFQLLAFTDGLDQCVCKIIALDVYNFCAGVVLTDAVSDRIDQMCFSKAGIAVDQQRVIGFGGRIGHGAGRGMRKLVGFTYHKVFKRKLPGLDQRGWFCHDPLAIGIVIIVAQQAYLEIRGKNIAQGCFDVSEKTLLNIAALEVGRAVQNKYVLLQSGGGDIIKPGIDRGFR